MGEAPVLDPDGASEPVSHPDHTLPIAPPQIAWQIVELVDCLCGMLEVEGGGRPCWCGAYPGASVSWEFCTECQGGSCGMGYVRPAGIFPYTTFPFPETDVHCASPLAWTIEVGALRCVPQPADGEVLSPADMLDVTITTMLDARAIYKAIKCCDAIPGAAIQFYTPVGPEGGCVGGFWTAFLDVPEF